MDKTQLIFNPMSDRGRSGQKASDLQAIVEKNGGADWVGTEYPGHAVKLAAQAGIDGYETIVAMGGDGTAHEVVNGLMRLPKEQRPRLGVVPIGSGNDFAYSSGIQMNPEHAMQRVFSGESAPVDVGLITDGNGRSAYFDNSAGMLIDAAVNIQSRKITRIYGFAMYVTGAIIENFAPTKMEFNIDGQPSNKSLIMFTIGNGAREGGGFMVTPDAKNNDGKFDFLMVTPISRPMMFYLLPEIMRGKHLRYNCTSVGTFEELKFTSDRAVPIHLDGELWAPYETNVREITVRIFPKAVDLIR